MKIRISNIAINIIAILIMAFFQPDVAFAIGLLLWINLFTYSLRDTGNRSMLLAFMISFFTFLIGRVFVQQFFSYNIESFEADVNHHLYLCIILSLSALFLGYLFCNRRARHSLSIAETNTGIIKQEYEINPYLKSISKYVFIFSWIFAITSKLVVARFVTSFGYSEYYTDFSEFLIGNTFLYTISKIEGIMPVAFSIFSATLPNKKEYRIPAFLYVVYIVFSLETGQRGIFVLGVLFLMVYYLYRNTTNPEERWITKRAVVTGLISVPILSVFLTILADVRMGEQVQAISLIDGMLRFLYEQGVTGNVIRRAYMYKEQIPNQLYTLEFLHSGILARLLNITVYHGNTIEHALYGGSFAHSLGYVVLGAGYLAGRGTGSSYIAELYQDFGYLGVVIGNVIYGYIIAHINRTVTRNNVLRMSIRFYIITQILWAPRASLTGFLSNLFAPLTILSFLFVFGFANLLKWHYMGASQK